MSLTTSLVGLLAVTALVSVLSDFLVSSIDGFTEQVSLKDAERSRRFPIEFLPPCVGLPGQGFVHPSPRRTRFGCNVETLKLGGGFRGELFERMSELQRH